MDTVSLMKKSVLDLDEKVCVLDLDEKQLARVEIGLYIYIYHTCG